MSVYEITHVNLSIMPWMSELLGLKIDDLFIHERLLLFTVAAFFLLYALVFVFHAFVRVFVYIVRLGRYRG